MSCTMCHVKINREQRLTAMGPWHDACPEFDTGGGVRDSAGRSLYSALK